MNDGSVHTEEALVQQRDAFIEKFLDDASGTFNIFAIYIGDRLGLYRALVEGGASTPIELAARTQTQERYVREWLEQQAMAGILGVENENSEMDTRRYFVPAGHVEPLIDCSSTNYMAPLAQLIAGAVTPLRELLNAYRNGGGVPYSAYGDDLREGQASINYPAFANQLANEWIPAMTDVHTRLQTNPPALIADIGCGFGWSSIAMAKGYPNAFVDGYDLDEPSIERARINAQSNHVGDKVRFHVRDASDPALAGQYDLVTAFECLHDMANPVGALRMMRSLAKNQGTVLIVDERVGERFSVSGNDVDGIMYGWSILHCLPVGMVEEHSAGTGTVMRPDTLRRYAEEAGFQQCGDTPLRKLLLQVLPFKSVMN